MAPKSHSLTLFAQGGLLPYFRSHDFNIRYSFRACFLSHAMALS
ncbi:hypothetical protein ACPOL_7004 (plasmid) [Acidisarcina polymorpha]|uniref:Uncharacterized protein n=1 Tax=Acidisarcina polymorpha TaxID=2211140 RepID=A0A2Z5GC30_9BACT|nr:hypothetical protein [Acidisarcina polymorpha]AXC16206.1 hypothetical protein ACPOL_7004 [Acidisarcina polymorpha]